MEFNQFIRPRGLDNYHHSLYLGAKFTKWRRINLLNKRPYIYEYSRKETLTEAVGSDVKPQSVLIRVYNKSVNIGFLSWIDLIRSLNKCRKASLFWCFFYISKTRENVNCGYVDLTECTVVSVILWKVRELYEKQLEVFPQ